MSTHSFLRAERRFSSAAALAGGGSTRSTSACEDVRDGATPESLSGSLSPPSIEPLNSAYLVTKTYNNYLE